MNELRVLRNTERTPDFLPSETLNLKSAKQVQAFHQSFPEYTVTPLADLSELAQSLNVAGIFVKDESFRFGLNAFKVLGGSYAAGRWIAKTLGVPPERMTYADMIAPETRRRLGSTTFITATDGNHGRGVAWTANRLYRPCVVYMPHGTVQERLQNIRALGADASILDCNYDECVRRAGEMARKNGWVLMQDTVLAGNEEIPGWIMQGYMTMGFEAYRQLEGNRPTHIILQAGVGSMAGALTSFFRSCYGNKPTVIVVEPETADCFYQTAEAHDGHLRFVTGDMKTIMAGLACGEPCVPAWDILRTQADFFVTIPEYVAANGMRILANPLASDPRVVSGESGASGFGFVSEVLRNPALANVKAQLGFNEASRILCVSTEGATDVANYRRIVWDGAYAAPGI